MATATAVLLVSCVWQTNKKMPNRLYYWSRLVQTNDQLDARIIGVLAEQTKVLLFAKRIHVPIIRLWSCDHEHN